MELSTDMMTVSSRTFGQLLPEAVLIATAVLVMVGGAFLRSAVLWRPLALTALVLAAIFLAGQPETADGNLAAVAESWPVGPVFAGDFSLLVRWMAIVFGGFYFLSSRPVAGGLLEAETIGLLLLIVAGTMLAGSAGDLVFIVLGLELVSIPTYGILFLARGQVSAWSTDAGEPNPEGAVAADWAAEVTVKYFFLSLFSSAPLLYGLSFLYGAAGSMDLPAIADTLAAQMRSAEGSLPGPIVEQLVPLAFLLMVAGLAFKLAAVPLHFYAPDVYQGTSHANAGLLAVAPKLAALAVLIRILATIGPALGDFAWQVLVVMAVVSMTWGNAMALRQREIRRMLAYSSIAHAGYLLVGLAVACGPVVSGVSGPAAGYSAGALLFAGLCARDAGGLCRAGAPGRLRSGCAVCRGSLRGGAVITGGGPCIRGLDAELNGDSSLGGVLGQVWVVVGSHRRGVGRHRLLGIILVSRLGDCRCGQCGDWSGVLSSPGRDDVLSPRPVGR